jgi:hypothetical protein
MVDESESLWKTSQGVAVGRDVVLGCINMDEKYAALVSFRVRSMDRCYRADLMYRNSFFQADSSIAGWLSVSSVGGGKSRKAKLRPTQLELVVDGCWVHDGYFISPPCRFDPDECLLMIGAVLLENSPSPLLSKLLANFPTTWHGELLSAFTHHWNTHLQHWAIEQRKHITVAVGAVRNLLIPPLRDMVIDMLFPKTILDKYTR